MLLEAGVTDAESVVVPAPTMTGLTGLEALRAVVVVIAAARTGKDWVQLLPLTTTLAV